MEVRIAHAVKIKTFRLHEPYQRAPVLFRVHDHDTEALARFLSLHMRKLRYKPHGCDGLTASGRAREETMHQGFFVNAIIERRPVTVIERITF